MVTAVLTKEHGTMEMLMAMVFLLSRTYQGMRAIGTRASTMAKVLT